MSNFDYMIMENRARILDRPLNIAEFRKEPALLADHIIIPEVSQKRKVTDFKFTICFGVCLLVLLPLLIYSFVNSDINRIVHGYDDCGNVCGENNTFVSGIECSGKDKTQQPYLLLRQIENTNTELPTTSGECVETCNETKYTVIGYRCIPNSENKMENEEEFAEIGRDIKKSAGYIVGLCFIGLGFCIGMLILFRFFAAFVVWFTLVGTITLLPIITALCWYENSKSEKNDIGTCVFFTILSVVVIIVFLCLIKRIKVVIRVIEEAIKIIFGIPLILFEPLLTFAAGLILLIFFVFFLIIWSQAGFLQQVYFEKYEYVPDTWIVITICYHVVICLWIYQFILGCQYMVIAGAVSAYYFTKDKSTLSSPIYNSFYNLIRYHLGTVFFGSLVITIITLVKWTLRGLAGNRFTKLLVECCIGYLEEILKYISKNAYIQTAMHGQPFFKSGKRATQLLVANLLNTIAINCIGDFVLTMAKVLIVVFTIGAGALMAKSVEGTIEHFWPAILISVIVTAIIAHCFFSVFETAIDTIFLCFCEDTSMNDGTNRPYYMSSNLMLYMEDLKKQNNSAITQE